MVVNNYYKTPSENRVKSFNAYLSFKYAKYSFFTKA